MDHHPFLTRLAVRDDVVVIKLFGELDLAQAERLNDHLKTARLLAEHAVVVDLSAVAFCVGSSLTALDHARASAFADGVALVLAVTALGVLSRHYHPGSGHRPRRMLHWGTEDYRPVIV